MITLDTLKAAATRFEAEVGHDLQAFKQWIEQEWDSIVGAQEPSPETVEPSGPGPDTPPSEDPPPQA